MINSLFTQLAEIVDIWSPILINDVMRYVIFASAAYVLINVALARRLAHRKIQDKGPAPGQISREIRYSLMAVAIMSLWGLVIYFGNQAGIMTVYTEIADYGWAYLVFSLALSLLAHDAWFYWTHRLMHHPRLYRPFHRLHHRSRTPTPWTAYAFAPLEAVVNGAFVPVFVLFVPTHPVVLGLFMIHMIARNVIGHSGYELFPRATVDSWWLKWLTAVTHHDLHHADMRYNFGLYFSWWDKLMGTEHPEYTERTRAKTAPRARPLQDSDIAPALGRAAASPTVFL